MGKKLFIGCRVRILYSIHWPQLKNEEGVIVGTAHGIEPMPGINEHLEWEVSPDCWGNSLTPPGVMPRGIFCPNSDQLEPILPRGLESGEEINKLFEPEKVKEKVVVR